jgi:cysteine desulfurase / selenocysteine lyase
MKQDSLIQTIRSEFPAAERMLYLDSAHQTPLCARVKAAIERFLEASYQDAGPKSGWLEKAELVRGKLAAFIGASADEVAFTKNTSESLNAAANALPLQAGDNVVLVQGDHPNNAYAWLNLRRKGVEVRFVNLENSETADASTFESLVDSKTRVISLSHVTFHAGQRHDIASIGEFCRQRAIVLVVDAMQSAGVLPVDVKQLGISILAAGSHKGLLVPHGLGFLYVSDAIGELNPAYLAMAGLADPPADFIARPQNMSLHRSARRFELGNLNLPGIHALDASIDLLNSIGMIAVEKHLLDLGDILIRELDELGIELVGPRDREKRAHIYVLRLPGEWNERFKESNVRVSPERDGVRVSFGVFNSVADIEALARIIRARRN